MMIVLEGKEIRKTVSGLLIVVVLLLSVTAQIWNLSTADKERSISKQFLLTQYTPQIPFIITQDSDFETVGFTGTGTESNPYLLESVSINTTMDAIVIAETSSFFIIRNSRIQAGNIGITMRNVSNGQVVNCEIQASYQGMLISESDSIRVEGCEFTQAVSGIRASDFDNSHIIESVFHHNDYGIDVTSGNNSRIEDSIFFANEYTGLQLSQGALNITVFSSTFGWNGHRVDGILIASRNAMDGGTNNTWISNRWSDYGVDGPYNIQGSAGSSDIFASLLDDVELPYVQGPPDIRYDEGETGNWLNWNATDDFPAHRSIYIDGEKINSQHWLDETFRFLADGFPLGSHNITIQYFDAAGNTVSDEVWVSVMINVFGSEGTEYILYASLTSILSVFVVIIVIKRMR